MSDFNITLFEACEFLNRSKKSISRYIRRGLLHPEKVKSKQGTLEYRFSKADLEVFKTQEVLKAEEARQDRTEETDQTGHIEGSFIKNREENDQSRQDTPAEQTGQENEILTALKETTGFLRDQLLAKDKQIDALGNKIDGLIERDRETNFILKSLQDKVFLLEQPKKEPINSDPEETGHDPEETGQDKPAKNGFWKRVFKSDL